MPCRSQLGARPRGILVGARRVGCSLGLALRAPYLLHRIGSGGAGLTAPLLSPSACLACHPRCPRSSRAPLALRSCSDVMAALSRTAIMSCSPRRGAGHRSAPQPRQCLRSRISPRLSAARFQRRRARIALSLARALTPPMSATLIAGFTAAPRRGRRRSCAHRAPGLAADDARTPVCPAAASDHAGDRTASLAPRSCTAVRPPATQGTTVTSMR